MEVCENVTYLGECGLASIRERGDAAASKLLTVAFCCAEWSSEKGAKTLRDMANAPGYIGHTHRESGVGENRYESTPR